MNNKYEEANKELWNEITPIHVKNYGVKKFKQGKTPILIIGGTNDIVIKNDSLEWLEHKINAELTMIPEATHNGLINDMIIGLNPNEGKVRDVTKIITDYINKVLRTNID